MSNVGIVNYWGRQRGVAILGLSHAKMLKDKHNLFVLSLCNDPIEGEFKDIKCSVQSNAGYNVNPEVFKKWVVDNKLNTVIFYEYDQWGEPDKVKLPTICKELGVKTLSFLVLERLKKEQADLYDINLAVNHTYERIFRSFKVRNFAYVPYSVDLTKFPSKEKLFSIKKDGKFIFVHIGGAGGVMNRKNTECVVKAFKMLDNKDCELIITSQRPLPKEIESIPGIKVISGNLDWNQLQVIQMNADCSLLPSKWESISLPILDSLACGVPVITTDIYPMNEYIQHSKNGFVCKANFRQDENITLPIAEVPPEELKQQMETMLNSCSAIPEVKKLMSKNSRELIEREYDLEKNKEYLLKLIGD